MSAPLRVRIGTASGSTYLFDREKMTWKRSNVNVGHEDIRGWEGIKEGTLDTFPERIEIGEPLTFYTEGTWVMTTPVWNFEDVT